MNRLGDTACRVLAAVLDLHARNGRVTVRDVAGAVGRSPGSVHRQLCGLRDAELITWEDGGRGTLRPRCSVVPYNEHTRGRPATLGSNNLSGRGAVDAAPGLAGAHQGGADMNGPYPRLLVRARAGA